MAALDKPQLEQLADFRYQLRLFLRFSEQLVRANGITPQQYQLLLQIEGYPQREWATIGELAERLQMQHHGMGALVSRCEQLGLVHRREGKQDRRTVGVILSIKGKHYLDQLAHQHWEQLQNLQNDLTLPKTRIDEPHTLNPQDK